MARQIDLKWPKSTNLVFKNRKIVGNRHFATKYMQVGMLGIEAIGMHKINPCINVLPWQI